LKPNAAVKFNKTLNGDPKLMDWENTRNFLLVTRYILEKVQNRSLFWNVNRKSYMFRFKSCHFQRPWM